MFYVIEEAWTQVDKDRNIWSKSIKILAVNSVKWKIQRYFKNIKIRYKDRINFDDFKVVSDDQIEFFVSLPEYKLVDLYITDNIDTVFEC